MAGFRGRVGSARQREDHAPALLSLSAPIIEIFCRCDRATAARRFRARSQPLRLGHFDDERTDEELWNDEVSRPLAGGWPVIEVDTSQPVELTALVEDVRRFQTC